MMNKEQVLSRVDSYEILNHYLRPFVPRHKWPLRKGNAISNPLIERKQNTPSFNIYRGEDGQWYFKDFSTSSDMQGSCFDFVMRLYGLDFPQALEKVAQDFNIPDPDQETTPTHKTPQKPRREPEPIPFEITLNDRWNEEESEWWGRYGIGTDTLDCMGVGSVKGIVQYRPEGKPWCTPVHASMPLYAYRVGTDCYKLYRPGSQDHRFSWLGRKPAEYVYGLDHLPRRGERVFITGGEKDVLSLVAHGHAAVCLNSETARPPKWLIAHLRERFGRVIVLYDLDATGMRESKRLAGEYGLLRLVLPQAMYERELGKDISDFYALMHSGEATDIAGAGTLDALIAQTEERGPTIAPPGSHLEKLLRHQEQLRKQKAKPVVFSKPILVRGEDAIIYPKTINLIQGKSGVHKSRLAEGICSTVLNRSPFQENPIGLKVNGNTDFTVCYVDTERNLTEQFPYAIQQIQTKAGYAITDNPPHFHYVSLLDFGREERYVALTEYLNWLQGGAKRHLFVVLDVITDCIGNFNQVSESLELVDAMNRAINSFDVTFLCVIHENPGNGSDKARGHLGTELANKASTVMQVGFERDRGGDPTDLIKLSFLKCRASKAHDPVYLQYCAEARGLILADNELLKQVGDSRQEKAPMLEVREYVEEHLGGPTLARELTSGMAEYFGCSVRLIEMRLSRLIKEEWLMKNGDGQHVFLVREGSGKTRKYLFKNKG
ncbi:MAG: hypothetical protein AAGN35_24345 [Bacteroidota bacterium]